MTGALSGKVDFPISYLAMPQGSTAATEGSTHVTFANATQGALNANNKLSDDDYYKWCAEDNPNREQNLEYILENVTVSDGKTTYTAKDNPYLNIEYIADRKFINSKYRNTHRYSLSSGGFKAIDVNALTATAFTARINSVSVCPRKKTVRAPRACSSCPLRSKRLPL